VTNQDRDTKGAPEGPGRTNSQTSDPGKDISGEKDAEVMDLNSTAQDDGPIAFLDERTQAQIGQQLSNFYKELVNQPIPQNFIDLLAKLDRQEDGK
jgi:hypothetical protein